MKTWMNNLFGLGFETKEEFNSYIKEVANEKEITISEINEPNVEFGDEFIDVGLYNGVLTCFIARGKSGRFYVVEVSYFEDMI